MRLLHSITTPKLQPRRYLTEFPSLYKSFLWRSDIASEDTGPKHLKVHTMYSVRIQPYSAAANEAERCDFGHSFSQMGKLYAALSPSIKAGWAT